jgi:hypothetical protein
LLEFEIRLKSKDKLAVFQCASTLAKTLKQQGWGALGPQPIKHQLGNQTRMYSIQLQGREAFLHAKVKLTELVRTIIPSYPISVAVVSRLVKLTENNKAVLEIERRGLHTDQEAFIELNHLTQDDTLVTSIAKDKQKKTVRVSRMPRKEKKPTMCPECHTHLNPNGKGVCEECGLILTES